MSDPGKSTAAELRYEVRLQPGPWKFSIRGVQHEIQSGRDAVVIMRMVVAGGMVYDERIVGVVGDEWEGASSEFLRLREFMNTGGVIGLHRDLQR